MATRTKKKTPAPVPLATPAIVSTMHIEGITYQRRFVSCGKDRCRKGCASGTPSHGPYWYAIMWNPKTGKTSAKYVGKNEPRISEIADGMMRGADDR
ncbi:MAG: hypothetical protein AB7O21_19625 [Gammaproteobacteria bacterium]